MDFKILKKAVQVNLANMVTQHDVLFVVNIDKDVLWNIYIDSFPEGTNPTYRSRREYDCSCCRSFIKGFGNVVAIKDNKIVSIWDFEMDNTTFGPVVKSLAAAIHTATIQDVFVTKVLTFGTDKSREMLDSGMVKTWDHFHVTLPAKFRCNSSESEASVMGTLRTSRDVFKRSLEEITRDSVETVLEIIAQKSLPKGDEWREPLKKFLALMKSYNKCKVAEKENFCWAESVVIGPALAKIKNHSIGTLLSDISEGMALETAVGRYDRMVAGDSYKRSSGIFTESMRKKAKETIVALGFEDSLPRRRATLDDISINNIVFANRDANRRITGSILDEMTATAPSKKGKQKFDKVEEIDIETFFKNILPTATAIEAYVENSHVSNMVSLIAPEIAGCKNMFKWNNPYSWAFKDNMATSMKERVKAAGGRVDGVLRFSIQWNEEFDNRNDFDAHVVEPDRNEIYYGVKGYRHQSSGMLDVDIIHPDTKQVAVENITYSDLRKMKEGVYLFRVKTFSHRGGTSGFRAELEFDGQTYSYDYRNPTRSGQFVDVVSVKYSKKDGFSIVKSLDASVSARDIWGIKTNQFHPVTVCMLSPNYWDENKGVGSKHYLFMLKDCISDETPNGFYNEFLIEDLRPHRQVFEALGGMMKVAETDDQLSGIGFSSDQRNTLICKVSGKFDRVLKVKF